jgi:hypothetical protein
MKNLKKQFQCEFCHSILSSKYSLKTHIATNKSCLSSRGLNINKNNSNQCNICGFNTPHRLIKHTCRPESIEMYNENKKLNEDILLIKEKYDSQLNNIITQKDKIITQKDKEIETILSDNMNSERQYDDIISELKKDIKRYTDQIFSIASQPKNVSNNTTLNQTNIKVDKMITSSFTEDLVKLKANQFMEIKHIDNGIKGYADFITEHMSGSLACTDVSRNILKYKDENNEIQTDTGGIKTGQTFFKGITPAAMKLFTERYDYLQKIDVTEEKRLEMVNTLIDNRSKLNSIVRGDIESEKERKDWAKYVGSQCKV